MQLSKTIAIARGVLAEGRTLDAARMIEPLLERNGHSASLDTGQIMLRCLMARIRLQRSGEADQVLELLGPYEQSGARQALEPPVRAEVALWLGWARTWQDDESYDGARALNLFDEAERAFRMEMNPTGRCWTMIGQAHAYFTMDEYELMLQALEEAAALQEKLGDVNAEMWVRHLAVTGARFEGRFRDALSHVDALEDLAAKHRDDFSLGRARAQKALLLYELGRNPASIVEAAEEAENLLLAASSRPGYSLLSAYHAHIGALIHLGKWDAADRKIDQALSKVGRLGTAPGYITLHRARLLLYRGEFDAASEMLENVHARVNRRHRLLLSNVERLQSKVLCARNELDRAQELAERALRSARDAGHAGYQLSAVLQLAEVAILRGESDLARNHVEEAEKFADYFSVIPFAARRFLIQAGHAVLQSKPDDARAHFAQAASAYSLIGDTYMLAVVQHRLAALNAVSSPADSRPLAEAALATFQHLNAGPDARRTRKLLRSWPRVADSDLTHSEADVGSILARAAISVDLVAEAWLQAAEKLAPHRWLVVRKYDENCQWSSIHSHGDVPADLQDPDPAIVRACADGVDWLRLRGAPGPIFYFGMECGGDDDPACAAIEQRLLPWIPVVGLALEHALLRSTRLGRSGPWDGVAESSFDVMVYSSARMREVVRQIRRIRSSRSPVLIAGESGVGKNLIARLIHDTSDRRDAPFVAFSSANLQGDFVDRQLFGHAAEGGAIAAAHGGTLLLDEVSALPAETQQKLLRFLESGEAVPPGRGNGLPADVRIIATTNQDLKELIRGGRFRESLYYRLSMIPLRLPPLRERREEIPLLVRHFLKGVPNASVTHRALDAMIQYDWPGNVRQLRNEIQRIVALSASEPAPLLDIADLSDAVLASPNGDLHDVAGVFDGISLNGGGLDAILSRAEKAVIEKILARNDGQVATAAETLGLTRQGLYKKMKRLGIESSQFQPSGQPAT